MLDKEFQYYLDNQEELSKLYFDKHVVIVGNEVKGSFENVSHAYKFGVEEYGLGVFLMQHCLPKKQISTIAYHSQLVINDQ